MRRFAKRRLALLLAGVTLAAAPAAAHAQETFRFSPSVSVLGSFSANPLQTPGGSLTANFLQADLELPFEFRGRRWSGGFTLRPGYQRYPDAEGISNFSNSASLAIEGRLSRRTVLDIDGAYDRSENLRGQIGQDFITPRALQIRASAGVRLKHELSRRSSFFVRARYNNLQFPDSLRLVSHQNLGVQLGFGHRLSERFGLIARARAQGVIFDDATRARSVSATAGFWYRLAPRTELEIEGGALFAQQDLQSGFETADGSPGYAARAELVHGGANALVSLLAQREFGSVSGLASAAIQNRLSASLLVGNGGWNFQAATAFVRSELLNDVGLASTLNAVDTWTGCVGAGLRVTPRLMAVGSLLFARQADDAANPLLAIDSYRVGAGFVIEADPPREREGRTAALYRLQLARSSHVTCR